eukprot:gene6953-9509_t
MVQGIISFGVILTFSVLITFINGIIISRIRVGYYPSLNHCKVKSDMKLKFCTNKAANHEYEFDEKIEAGIMLSGTEVKSCRKNQVQLSDGIAEIRDGECWLLNVHIAEYNRSGRLYQHKPKRDRKLLLHSKEILKIEQRLINRNYELIPLQMYFSDKNYVKVELGIGKKKSLIDKRDDLIKKDGEREVRRVMKNISYD